MSVQPGYDPKCADRYHAYRQGWRDGAAGRMEDAKFTEHKTRPDIVEAYNHGYAHADIAASAALRYAKRKYKFTPSILRDLAEPRPRSLRGR